MNNKTFLSVHAIIYAVFAVALFVVPAQLWPIYGVQINDEYAYFLSQHTSIFLGGIAIISWLMRDTPQGKPLSQLIKGLLFTNLIGVAITTFAGVTGIFTGMGWSDPIFFSVMSVLSWMQLKRQ
ncbi:hypothetical protein MJ923_01105 [Shewanella sp. 3B26]|uniref:Uncharacterized protein n=1 Tax=Shewanella zhuhaiensis TaxID=2919576 RepID=A0AAJ1BDS1_9GAMM|nr:hypothetical protein [Shewanella zhuhaiensis]MCH4292899.1 hypothetical protein [Shewanella zhuhaiensis]